LFSQRLGVSAVKILPGIWPTDVQVIVIDSVEKAAAN
jgi:hypothetical protein